MAAHETFGLNHPKLDKLNRRVQFTSGALTAELVEGWDDHSTVDRALDEYLKAQELYWEEQKRMLAKRPK